MFRNFIYFIFLKIIIFLNFFIKIRFQELQTRNIGHYSKSIEVYLSEVDCGLQLSYKFDFWIKNKYSSKCIFFWFFKIHKRK